jgi:pimeloyl-ACP methyl ester carboxylesterase
MGEGRPVVVFDAALGGSSISWTLVHAPVAAMTRACAYDRAGFAWSDAGPMPRTAGRAADELRVLLANAGEPPPYVLVGHSFGGFVMRIFAARYPEITAGLVLVDPAHPADWLDPSPRDRLKVERGTQLCRQGAFASKIGLARVVSELVGIGAATPARKLVDLFTRGGIAGDADWILAPLWKLPPPCRKPLRSFWTHSRFYDALGSQIANISTSAAEAAAAAPNGYGDLPLVTISAAHPDDVRSRLQDALARMSTRGRHIVASHSGHWIPLDEPEVVIAAVEDVVRAVRETPTAR